MATTSVSLTDHHKKIIEDQIASGRYASTSDVIREGLRLVEDREYERRQALATLDALLEEALARGGAQELNEDYIQGVKRRGRKRLRSKMDALSTRQRTHYRRTIA